ncbi:MAG: hypothetical protein JEZ00_02070 [Anaerolineaceae bacterium]|nr:hypothetical protein [Anaerolineaceae bacterium]
MRIPSKWLAGITIFFIFGGIMASTWLGWWQTKSTKVPARFSSENYIEQYNPADIRGSYTFGEVSSLFNIPLSDLKIAFALSYDDISIIQLNQLEEIFTEAADNGKEIGTSSVQLFTAYYNNLPFDAMDEYLPQSAVSILLEKAQLSVERITYLESHTVNLDDFGINEEIPAPIPANEQEKQDEGASVEPILTEQEHSETEDYIIKGNTTFREVLDWGVSEETIKSILGNPMPNPLFTVKDYCMQEGLSFGSIKASLQLEVPAN